jgi:hypothetical protein
LSQSWNRIKIEDGHLNWPGKPELAKDFQKAYLSSHHSHFPDTPAWLGIGRKERTMDGCSGSAVISRRIVILKEAVRLSSSQTPTYG